MAITKLNGIVLSGIKFQESSKILKLYTKEEGLITVIAKGVSSSKKGNAGMEPLCISNFTVYTKETRKIQKLTNADIVEYHIKLREDLYTLSAAQAASELISKVVHELQPSEKLYTLFTAYLKRLNLEKNKNRDFSLRMVWCFFARFISISGFTPSINKCAGCGNTNNGLEDIFSLSKGGFICNSCDDGLDKKHTARLSRAMSETLKFAFTGKVEDFEFIKLQPREDFIITDLLEKIIKFNFELNLEISSLKFLKNGVQNGILC